MHLHGYGCAGASAVAYGLACLELEAGDSGLRSLVSVQGSLAMYAIWRFGTDGAEGRVAARDGGRRGDRLLRADRARPRLRPGLDEDPGRRDGDDWLLSGTKMWITNAPVADVAVVWARTDERHRRLRGADGHARRDRPRVRHKLSLRASSTGEMVLDDVRLPADALLPEARGLKAPLSCLTEARYGIVWGALGAARDCLETAIDYAGDAGAVRPADRRLPAHPGQARRRGARTAEGLPARAAPGPAGRRRHSCGPSRSASASSTTSARRSRSPGSAGPSSAPTGSAPSTRSCGTRPTWRRVLTYEGTSEIHQLVIGQQADRPVGLCRIPEIDVRHVLSLRRTLPSVS